jgi:ferredoxin-NADP reductase
VTVGSRIEAAAPRGEFVLLDEDCPVLLVSAGIGVTPVLAMLHGLAAERSSREVWWLHATRNAEEHAFAAEAHHLMAGLVNGRERIFYSRPMAPIEDPSIVRGRLDAAALASAALPSDAVAYVCGPASFMDDVRASLAGLGIAADRVHTEVFGTLAPINPGIVGAAAVTPHPPPADGTGPQVTFARSGLTVQGSQSYASLLELAEACDVPTRWSCRTGVCHTCATALLAGSVRYRPEPLEAPRAGDVLICCAQPDADIVLDL